MDNLEPSMRITDLFYNPHYSLYYTNVATFLILDVIPIFCLIYYNYRIYKAMKSSSALIRQGTVQNRQYKQEKNLAKVMIGIVIVFILCHSLRGIIFLYVLSTLENVKRCNATGNATFLGPLWFYILFSINSLLLAVNSAVNMIIYCCINSKFRKHLIAIIMPFSSRLSNATTMRLTQREAE